ncbi:uncharacterized protein THITE_2132117 [Thermothielavioides terrestris NRRL 8126]|uniref:Uncharacterized protein n=1 Tax=Thermothielavioides terrestris (strain ATCC 38088 / NRRL 8126) TaxID=578455 RepID=G2RCS2_THETT|nr:uncharacterized protein THITE_2132117 [Thermothielavioides terrestris NRRL 8126]AEO70668.1 hypothetical protein THITE_2132117 [Thermothielavioides terrestris NRRL 8126]
MRSLSLNVEAEVRNSERSDENLGYEVLEPSQGACSTSSMSTPDSSISIRTASSTVLIWGRLVVFLSWLLRRVVNVGVCKLGIIVGVLEVLEVLDGAGVPEAGLCFARHVGPFSGGGLAAQGNSVGWMRPQPLEVVDSAIRHIYPEHLGLRLVLGRHEVAVAIVPDVPELEVARRVLAEAQPSEDRGQLVDLEVSRPWISDRIRMGTKQRASESVQDKAEA